jgi:hypothetical protein
MKKILTIWMQPIYARLNMESKKSLFILLALFPVAGQVIAGLLALSRPDKFETSYFLIALLMSLAALFAVLFISWFVVLAQNIALQYSPANARLVPHLPRILKLALCIPIVVTAFVSSGVMWLVVHQFSFFPAFVSVFMLSFLVVTFRSSWAIVPFILCFQMPAILKRLGVVPVDKLFSENLGVSFEIVLLLSSILILWATLRWIFSIRDEALFKLQDRSHLLRDAVSGKKVNENKISMGFATPFLIWMRTCVAGCTSFTSDRNATLKLSPFALGPRLHWSSPMLQMIMIVFFCGLSLLLVSLLISNDGKDMISGMSASMGGLSLIMLPFIFSGMLFSTLFQTKTEQALVCLAPGSGAQDRRDRIMMNYLLRQFSILFICSVLFALLMGYWVLRSDKDSEKIIAGIVLLLSCFFPMILVLTRQHARMESIADHPLLKSFFVCALLFTAGLVMVLYMPLSITFVFCGLVLLVTVMLFARYRRLQLSRPIFPVGRAV